MLEEAHEGLEVMSAVCSAIKGEEWAEAERCLTQIKEITDRLLREVGEMSRRAMTTPKPSHNDPA
jgi:hypothetical protein